MAFKMYYNLILNWALSQKGVLTKHSYCIGIVDGLYGLPNKEQGAWTANYGMNQLIVANGKKVAENYLKPQHVKLRCGRKKTTTKDQSDYKGGKKASKKINVRGKRLK